MIFLDLIPITIPKSHALLFKTPHMILAFGRTSSLYMNSLDCVFSDFYDIAVAVSDLQLVPDSFCSQHIFDFFCRFLCTVAFLTTEVQIMLFCTQLYDHMIDLECLQKMLID
jgi:hypothetical protein